jgi:hypothetical protein
LGEETITKDSFLEAIKNDYSYVKYQFCTEKDELYYRFSFFRESSPDNYFKITLKFYTTTD